MLIRGRVILNLMAQIDRPLTRTEFVKLVFLLRHESSLGEMTSFYDFVPYKYGPFSFTLYWEMERLRQNGYINAEGERISICKSNLNLVHNEIDQLTVSTKTAVSEIVRLYGNINPDSLVRDVYQRYPWFAQNSLLPQRSFVTVNRPAKTPVAVYTTGYEGKSVDLFFNHLLKNGIDVLIDVRANPISRKYGFSGKRLDQFCERLGLEYRHIPSLGIPSNERIDLSDYASYQRLLRQYERSLHSQKQRELTEVGQFMRSKPSVLMCVERDVRCCHRGRLADAISKVNGLNVVHL